MPTSLGSTCSRTGGPWGDMMASGFGDGWMISMDDDVDDWELELPGGFKPLVMSSTPLTVFIDVSWLDDWLCEVWVRAKQHWRRSLSVELRNFSYRLFLGPNYLLSSFDSRSRSLRWADAWAPWKPPSHTGEDRQIAGQWSLPIIFRAEGYFAQPRFWMPARLAAAALRYPR